MPKSDWLCGKEAAAYLATLGCPIHHKTLANMRNNNNALKGPSYVRAGWRTVRYRKADLEAWARRKMVRVE